MKRSTWLVGLVLVLIILIAACAAPFVVPVANQPTVSVKAVTHGVDPTLPHAKGVLMQYCTEPGCELRLIDPASGEALPGYAPVDLGKYANYGLALNGKTLATLVYPSNMFGPSSGPTGGVLQLVDLQAWQVITTTLTFNEGGGAPSFSPDGARLALAGFKYTWPPSPLLHLVDITRQTQIAQVPLEFRPSHMQFTTDGASILLYGNNMGVDSTQVNPQVYVAQVSASDLTIEWQTTLPAYKDGLYNSDGSEPHSSPETSFTWQPAVVFAPNASLLYIVHADKNELTTVDFERRTVQMAPITPAQSWIERWLALTARTARAKVFNGASKQAALAPDGRYLYVVGVQHEFKNKGYSETPLGMQVIDLVRSVEIAHIDSAARSLSLSPDGMQLYLHCWESDPAKPYTTEWTEVVDTDNFQVVAKLEDRAITLGQRLDGQPILLSTITRQAGEWEAAALHPDSLAVIHTWTNKHEQTWGWFVTQ